MQHARCCCIVSDVLRARRTHHNDSGTSLGPDPASSGGLANCWRTTNDIKNAFSEVMNRAHINDQFAKYAGPHHWNDPDMLEVGNAGVTVAEGQSHFALWYDCLLLCIVAE